MVKFVIRVIQRAGRRPLVSLSWTLFTAAAVYVAHYYVENPDATSKLEDDAIVLENLEKERARAEAIYLDWDHVVNYDSNSVIAEINRDFSTPTTNERYLAYLDLQRVSINKLRILVNATRFTSEAYESVRSAVAGDIPVLKEYNKKKLSMMKLFFTDSVKARKKLAKLTMPEESDLKYLELQARFKTLEETVELARLQHNVLVRSYNSRRQVYQTKGWINIIAISYMAGFAGYWLGLAVNRRKRKWLRPHIIAYRREKRAAAIAEEQPVDDGEQGGRSSIDLKEPGQQGKNGNNE